MSRQHPHPEPTAAPPEIGAFVQYFGFSSQARGPQNQTLYLSADANGVVSVCDGLQNSAAWLLNTPPDNPAILFFIHALTGRALDRGPGNVVRTMPFVGESDPNQCWNRSSIDREGVFAIRLYNDQDLNLNISGDGPYGPGSQIIVFHWDNQPNSKWGVYIPQPHFVPDTPGTPPR